MNENRSRRDALQVGLLATGLFAAASVHAATPTIDLNDPQQRLRAKVKMIGTLADGPVHTLVRLHIYGYANDGNLVPFFSMNNYAVNVWRRLPSGNYAVRVYESGVYTKFDEDEPLTEWRNPWTEEVREVHQFRSGPLNVEFGPDGIIAGPETTVKPKPMAMEIIEDTVFNNTQSSFRFPSPFQPEEFPKESPGKLFFWDSHFAQMSPLKAVLDPDTQSAPSEIMLTNFVSWAPWLGMGQRPGRTYGRGFGRKIAGAESLPASVRSGIEKFTPQVLDIANWGPDYDDIEDYKQRLKNKR